MSLGKTLQPHGVRHPGPGALDPAAVSIRRGTLWYGLPVVALVVGGAGLAGAAALALAGDEAARVHGFHAYLVAFLFWLSIALGGLFFVIVQFATRAGWSVVVRRLAESLMVGLPLFALLFLPVAVGLHDLYHWTHAEAVAADVFLQRKAGYLNEPFFYARAALYFVVWSALGIWYYRRSVRQDADGDPGHTKRMQWWSGPAIVLFALSLTFAAFDWIMSLDPHWYSTMYGVYYFAGSILAAFALLGLMAVTLRRAGVLRDVVTVEHFHDLGKLMFAFTVFWAYIAFSQYFLIWYANMPEETIWYAHRWEGSWRSVSILLGVGHFALPFFFLLPRAVKRKGPALVAAAVWLLFVHLVDLYWQVMPNLHPHGVQVGLVDVLAFVGVGGLYAGVVGLVLRRKAAVPVRDPRLPESLAFENA